MTDANRRLEGVNLTGLLMGETPAFLYSASSPRVVRSSFAQDGQFITIAGHMFEDGVSRFVVPTAVSEEDAEMLGQAWDALKAAEVAVRVAEEAVSGEIERVRAVLGWVSRG